MQKQDSQKLRLFIRSKDGVMSVEFAILGPIFLLLICVWVEIGITLFMQSVLHNAVRNASRQIQTGSATESSFRTAVCTGVSPIISCERLLYKIQSATNFASIEPNLSAKEANFSTNEFKFGQSGNSILVQVAYKKTSFFDKIIKNTGFEGNFLIYSTVTFKKESY
jgi:Flp pilus assembly protein TadG